MILKRFSPAADEQLATRCESTREESANPCRDKSTFQGTYRSWEGGEVPSYVTPGLTYDSSMDGSRSKKGKDNEWNRKKKRNHNLLTDPLSF